MKSLFLFLCLSISFISFTQDKNDIDSLGTEQLRPIPKKATLYSAIIPGAGQIYNKKYWKVPILYAGFGITAYYLNDNLKNIKRLRNEVNQGNLQFLDDLDQYKSWRDLSYVSFALIYALNIIDANVDAHLAHFDVGADLSLEILPYTDLTAYRSSGFTLVLKL